VTNALKQKLDRGEPVFGFWSMIPSPMVSHVMASSGADFVISDLEHGNSTLESLEAMNYAIRAAGATPICRLPKSGPEHILQVLEVGLQSILMSHISTPGEAQALVGSCLYPPRGDRGLSPFTSTHGYDGSALGESMADANEQMFVGALVEGRSALAELATISATPDLDMIYLGLFDLASTLGHADDPDHPEVRELVGHAVSEIRRSGKIAGTVARDFNSMAELLELGFQFIAYRNDTALLMQACRSAATDFEKLRSGR
jgi:4-hydroxy-2-oxoheptanedioate aldolase